jgi:Spy/CpxP family protein refolding chaperone
MKRGMWFALLAVLAAVLVVGGMAMAESDYSYGPGWRHGPGMMWGGGGYGPGMMWGGGGYGPGMMGGDMGRAFPNLPAEKQEQLRKVQVATGQAMVALMAEMQTKRDALEAATAKFPVDQAAAKKANEAVIKVRDQMFAQQLSTLAQVQQIVGKEAWEAAQSSGYGPGAGRGPGRMGPGGRGWNR